MLINPSNVEMRKYILAFLGSTGKSLTYMYLEI